MPGTAEAGSQRGALSEWLSIALVIGLFVILFAQIVLRTVGVPLIWVEEFSIAAFIWLSFVGICVAYRRGEHLAIDLVHEWAKPRLPARAAALWEAGLDILSFVFFVAFAVGLGIMAENSWGLFAGSISGFRQAYIYLGVLAAVLLTLWELGQRIAAGLRTLKRNKTQGPSC